MNKKRMLSNVMLLMVIINIMSIFTGCGESNQIPIPQVEDGVYIYDQDDIIDDDVESLLDKTVEDYSNELFNTLGIGKKGEDNGLLLLFSQSDEKVRLEIGRGLEGCLNDGKCGEILDTYFVPYREKDDYPKATEYTVKAVLNILAEEYSISINGLEKDLPTEDEEKLPIKVLITLAVILIAIIIVAAAISGDDNFSGGGFSSGGFSSGGFGGGFGGGFSGGGGASR